MSLGWPGARRRKRVSTPRPDSGGEPSGGPGPRPEVIPAAPRPALSSRLHLRSSAAAARLWLVRPLITIGNLASNRGREAERRLGGWANARRPGGRSAQIGRFGAAVREEWTM